MELYANASWAAAREAMRGLDEILRCSLLFRCCTYHNWRTNRWSVRLTRGVCAGKDADPHVGGPDPGCVSESYAADLDIGYGVANEYTLPGRPERGERRPDVARRFRMAADASDIGVDQVPELVPVKERLMAAPRSS